jgi:hypothetical protein
MSPSVAARCASLHRVATCRGRSFGTGGLQLTNRGHFIIYANGHSCQMGLTSPV